MIVNGTYDEYTQCELDLVDLTGDSVVDVSDVIVLIGLVTG